MHGLLGLHNPRSAGSASPVRGPSTWRRQPLWSRQLRRLRVSAGSSAMLTAEDGGQQAGSQGGGRQHNGADQGVAEGNSTIPIECRRPAVDWRRGGGADEGVAEGTVPTPVQAGSRSDSP